MLISHSKKFIYTKTIKTASTSVELYFEEYCKPDHTKNQEAGLSCKTQISENGIIGYRGRSIFKKEWYEHMPAKKIFDNLKSDVWDKYFKFCTVRNPYDKLISGFFHLEQSITDYPFKAKLKKIKNNIFKWPSNIILCEFEGDNPIERFRSWLKNGGGINDRDKYLIDGKVCIDHFIRYEYLHDDIRSVCDKLDIEFTSDKLPTIKYGLRSNQFQINDFYDRDTIEIVKKNYHFEIEKFGYLPPK